MNAKDAVRYAALISLSLVLGTDRAVAGGEELLLVANDAGPPSWLGGAVAVSGTTAVVGAQLDPQNGTLAGSAYLFDLGMGQQIAKLLPVDVGEGDGFGGAVAASGGRCVVGCSGDEDLGTNSGSAYLFDLTSGAQLAKLLAFDGVALDRFGWAVAMDGGLVAVSSPWDDDNGSISGAVYVFDAISGGPCARR